jgi:hypothetical protein
MSKIGRICVGLVMLAAPALADSTSYSPRATGFTLPNAQQAITALSAQSAQIAQTAGYAATAGSTGYATTAGLANSAAYATSAGSATTAVNATSAITANSAATAGYATNSGVASQAAQLTAGNNCPAGTALTVTNGILGCVSSVTSITGQLNGAQIVGNLNVGSINASGNIVSSGYTYGIGGLFSDTAVYANIYADRSGGASATYLGTATASNYAASSVVGILHQNVPGDGSTYYCDAGYHSVFYDTNVNSTNNAFFFACVRDGY